MLAVEQLETLSREGYLHLPAFFSAAHCEALLSETAAIMSEPMLESPRDEVFYARYGSDNVTFVDKHGHGALLGELADGPRLRSLAEAILPAGATFHMSLLQLSEPGRRQGIAWHQDVDPAVHPGALYNFLIYPEALTSDNGPLLVVPGTHDGRALPAGDPYGPLPGQRALVAGAGDLVIVHGTLFHCVPRNQTQRRRFSLNFRFRDRRVDAGAMTVGVYRNGKFDYSKGAPVVDAEPGMSPAMAALLQDERTRLPSGMTPGFLAAPRVFSRGKGVYLYDLDGREVLDFSSGTFTNSTGHCHDRVVPFMQERVAELWNIHDYASPYRAGLLRQLDALTPPQIDTFELYSGGAETVEAGLRALYSAMPEGKKALGTFKQSYHGKTRGARSLVGWSMPGEPLAPAEVMLDFPNCYRCPFGREPTSCQRQCEAQLERAFDEHPELGAVVLEPILGAGGVVSAPSGYLERLGELCRQHGVLLFIDEICVGFGRTGRDFSFQHYGLEPDLMAFAKGMGSGFPVMALGGRRTLMTRPPFGSPGGASTTFGGNPLAVAAMHITIDVYRQERLAQNAAALEPVLAARLDELAACFPAIGQARTRGLFACLDLVTDRASKQPDDALGLALHRRCMELGLKTFAFGHIFRIAPPLIISERELLRGIDLIERALGDLRGAAKAA